MRINGILVENIKSIKIAKIEPDENIVKITGKNAQGKTSVLDSIVYALGGKREIPDNALREGAEEGRVKLEFGDYVVEREFDKDNPGGKSLKVTNKEGAEFSSPQSLLNSFTEDVAFDPLEFSRLDDKEQAEQLKEVADLDLDELERKKDQVYDERREVNSYKKKLKNKVDSFEQTEPVEQVSVSDLSDKIEKQRDLLSKKNRLHDSINANKQKIKQLEKKLKNARKEQEDLEEEYEEVNEEYDPDKLEELQEKMDKADEQNQKANKYQNYKETKEEYEEIASKHQELDDRLKELREEKTNRIENADMPIDNLGIEDGKVTYKGIEFKELSSSERLRVSLSIAMAMNPDLRTILARDASLLDEDHLEVIAEMAKDKDYQIWLEMVDDSGEVGVVIEEGEVKKVNN